MLMKRGSINKILAPLLLGFIAVGFAACESTTPAAGPRVLVETHSSGGGGQTTEVFTVAGDWDLRWSYDCSPSLRNWFRQINPCAYDLSVRQMSDCHVSLENQGVNQNGVKDHGLVHYHTGGEFYLVVESDGPWTVTISGSGRASGVGPAPLCGGG